MQHKAGGSLEWSQVNRSFMHFEQMIRPLWFCKKQSINDHLDLSKGTYLLFNKVFAFERQVNL